MTVVTTLPDRKYKCTHCSRSFHTLLGWHKHLLTHPKELNNWDATVLEQEAYDEIEESS